MPHLIEQAIKSTFNLQLLGTSGCHLCDIAEKLVRRVAPPLGVKILIVDIADNDTLVDQYGMSIPVLISEQNQVLCWPFDEQRLVLWLESL